MTISTFALFFLMSLATFNLEDAGWSHNGTGSPISNSGGAAGAWLSDFAYEVDKRGSLPFYKHLARLAADWVELERTPAGEKENASDAS